jgi:hypothetical protein
MTIMIWTGGDVAALVRGNVVSCDDWWMRKIGRPLLVALRAGRTDLVDWAEDTVTHEGPSPAPRGAVAFFTERARTRQEKKRARLQREILDIIGALEASISISNLEQTLRYLGQLQDYDTRLEHAEVA